MNFKQIEETFIEYFNAMITNMKPSGIASCFGFHMQRREHKLYVYRIVNDKLLDILDYDNETKVIFIYDYQVEYLVPLWSRLDQIKNSIITNKEIK